MSTEQKKGSPITFIVEEPDNEKRTVTLSGPVIKVGSLSSAQLELHGNTVSRMHAYFQESCNTFYVSDLGSAHGTKVNGQRVNKAKLQSGDVLEFGDVKVTVKLEEKRPNPHGGGLNDFEGAPRNLEDLKRKLGPKKDNDLRVEVKNVKTDGDVSGLDFHQQVAGLIWDGVQTVAGKVRETWKERNTGSGNVYYCEQCLAIHGKVVEMEGGVLDEPTPRPACPECLSEWKINRGQARHFVSLKLQHYQALAKKLGILDGGGKGGQ